MLSAHMDAYILYHIDMNISWNSEKSHIYVLKLMSSRQQLCPTNTPLLKDIHLKSSHLRSLKQSMFCIFAWQITCTTKQSYKNNYIIFCGLPNKSTD